MVDFGLNERTGVEIGEMYDGSQFSDFPNDVLRISSI